MTSRRTGALAAITVFLLSPVALAKDFKPASGVYDGLVLAVDPASGVVSGYIRADWIGNGTAAVPQFTSEFAFAGEGGRAQNRRLVARRRPDRRWRNKNWRRDQLQGRWADPDFAKPAGRLPISHAMTPVSIRI
jgi:hypothetical protein